MMNSAKTSDFHPMYLDFSTFQDAAEDCFCIFYKPDSPLGEHTFISITIYPTMSDKINIDLLDELTTVSRLGNKIDELKQFYNRHILSNNGTLYTTDHRNKMRLLDNNIMLDASGKLQSAYQLDQKLYHLVDCPKVLDHSRWTLYNIKINSTKAGITPLRQTHMRIY